MSKAVMTVHGFLSDINDFDVLYDYLNPLYDEVVKCKIPGHDDEIDYKLFNKNDTLSWVYDTFDDLASRHDTVDIIGFSMGGALSSMLTATRNVNRAVLIAPSNKYINVKSFFKIAKFYLTELSTAMKEINGNVGEKLIHADESIEEYKENTKFSLDFAMHRIVPNINFHTYGVFRSLMKHTNQALMDKGAIEVPTFVMWGKLDELVPFASIEFVSQFYTHLETHFYDDVGHAMLMTNLGHTLSKDIVAFLQKEKIEPTTEFDAETIASEIKAI